jgi:hypothetical protein
MVIAVHIPPHRRRRACPWSGAAVEPDTTFARSDSMSQEDEKHQAKDDAYHRV